MKSHTSFITAIALLVTALLCAPAVARQPTVTAAAGSFFATAIRVPAANERDGVRYERGYLASHYRGARLLRQRLGNHTGHVYDIMTIATADGKQQDVYFDITSYFGYF
jgi:hypothetical protein